MSNDSTKSLLKSATSMVMAYVNATNEYKLDKNEPDDRAMIEEGIEMMADTLIVDETSWSRIGGSKKMLYDIYLEMRREEGTVTETDMCRPGLTQAMFSSTKEYYDHCVRVSESRGNGKMSAIAGEKQCSECNKALPRSKFKRNGGSKCNACMCAAYRKRRAEREKE